MKTMTKFIALSIMLLGLTAGVFAQGVTATATATATIMTPITITKDVDLNFGNLAVNATAGTLDLATNNNRSVTGGVTLMPGGTITAASFTVTGVPAATYSISLPASIVITDGTHNMTVDGFISSPTPTGTLTLGSSTLLVGATLNVLASQAAGIYTNTTDLDVTVNYN